MKFLENLISGLYTNAWAILLVLALIAGGYLYVGHLKSEITTLNTSLIQKDDAITSLSKSIKDQNVAFDQLKLDGDARLAKADADLVAAKNVRVGTKEKAMLIYRYVPAVGEPDCSAALRIGNLQ